ncbi:MAG TPA: extracellular solute-binding protein [Streptosporangiaceae bacterium]|nr:extracellular solute-binding protein [Streptosporangiaceae bacterium]
MTTARTPGGGGSRGVTWGRRITGRRGGVRLLAAGAFAVALAAAGCGGSSGGGGGGGSKTLTELDYFEGGNGQAIIWYNKHFEATHPGWKVKRELVPFANLMPKVLQAASAGVMPNIVFIDNPNVPQVAATGQLRPIDSQPGFTTAGYTPGAINECTFQGKHYCYPVGTNSVGIFYNKQMLAAAHVPPPKTWAELVSAAQKLTKGNVKGIAFDATQDEQSTWQLEPFFWSNGGSLTNVNTPAVEQALQTWVTMVKNGSASKSVLNWGQDPDLTQQFLHKKAAMIEDGPWIFPELNQAGWKYNKQYGIVPIPTRVAGQKVIAPLGGETEDLGNSGSDEQKKMAWEYVKGMQQPSVMLHVDSLMYYLPTKPAVIDQELKQGPQFTVFAHETESARPRTTEYGSNYPKVSQAIWTAIQAAITGTASPSSALNTAQTTISSVPQVKGG